MAVLIDQHELFNACRLLFGNEPNINLQFLEYLQISGIKTAYRKKALETHPDMLAQKNGGSAKNSTTLFMAVQQAYECLTTYLDERERGFRFRPSPVKKKAPTQPPRPRPQNGTNRQRSTSQSWRQRAQTHARKTSASAHQSTHSTSASNNAGQSTIRRHHHGPLPTRKLLFGHFLYYSGVANWQTIVKALVWQRTARPRLGEIGCRFGWLSSQDILHILKRRDLKKSFGRSAVDMGYLTENQLRLMVFQQKRLQKKFGEYFVHNKLLSSHELQDYINRFRHHNTIHQANSIYSRRM